MSKFVHEVKINSRAQKIKKKSIKNKNPPIAEDEKLYSCLYIADEGISKLNLNMRTLPSLTFKNKFMQSPNMKKTKVEKPKIDLEESFLSSNSELDESNDEVDIVSVAGCSSEGRRPRIGSVYKKFNLSRKNSFDSIEDSEVNKCTNKTLVGSQWTKKNDRKSFFLKQNSYDKFKIERNNCDENRFIEKRSKFKSSN